MLHLWPYRFPYWNLLIFIREGLSLFLINDYRFTITLGFQMHLFFFLLLWSFMLYDLNGIFFAYSTMIDMICLIFLISSYINKIIPSKGQFGTWHFPLKLDIKPSAVKSCWMASTIWVQDGQILILVGLHSRQNEWPQRCTRFGCAKILPHRWQTKCLIIQFSSNKKSPLLISKNSSVLIPFVPLNQPAYTSQYL